MHSIQSRWNKVSMQTLYSMSSFFCKFTKFYYYVHKTTKHPMNSLISLNFIKYTSYIMNRTKKSEKPMNLLDTLVYLNSKRIKYHNFITQKPNSNITFNEFLRDYFDMDKKFNNGKNKKRLTKGISKVLANTITSLF